MNFVLDITRLVSRAHLPFDTGIDRVERAFVLDSLVRFADPLFIAKAGGKYNVLGPESMQAFLDIEASGEWGGARGSDVFRRKLTKKQRAVRTTLRRLSKAHFSAKNISLGLAKLGLGQFNYTNVGHTNLDADFLAALKQDGCNNLSVFVHDVIPLDFPELCRQDTIQKFAKNMQSVAAHSDWILCNSDYTVDRTRHHFEKFGRIPKFYRGHLASPPIRARDKNSSKTNLRTNFVILGTIEPRKNLNFLLEVWELLALQFPENQMPTLCVVGKRGWEDTTVLKRLDKAKLSGAIKEFNDLDDAGVKSLLANSAALLFPSIVEGYGLPAQEAIALGTPVIASDIPVFQELFSESATLLPNNKASIWAQMIAAHVLGELTIGDDAAQSRDKSVTWNIFFDMLYKNVSNE